MTFTTAASASSLRVNLRGSYRADWALQPRLRGARVASVQWDSRVR